MDECKTCASCREGKPYTAFNRSKGRRDGRHPYCKTCLAAMNKGLDPRKPDPNRPVAGPGEKVCGKCVTAKPLNAFGADRTRADGLFPYCRECKMGSDRNHHARYRERRNAENRDRYKANPEPYKARARAYYDSDREHWKRNVRKWCEENPERRREIRTASFRRAWTADPERFREAWRRRHALIRKGCAVYPFTQEQLAAKVAYWGDACWMCRGPWDSIDHVKPLAKGGPHALVNLRPACTSCNSRKSDRWPFTPAA